MRLRHLRVKHFSETSAQALEDAVNDWAAGENESDPGPGQELLESVEFHVNGSEYLCFITYVEE